jgi:hypothetical protein
MSTDGKISFFLERSESGRFKAHAPGFEEIRGNTLRELRSSINQVVRQQFGKERPVALMVGRRVASESVPHAR